MTYREPDPELRAAAEQQIAADAKLELDAAAGRDELAHRVGIERRFVHAGTPGVTGMAAVAVTGMVAMAGATALGLMMPIGIAIGVATVVAGGAGLTAIDRVRLRREAAWRVRQAFPILGYEHVLASRRVVVAIKTTITLATSEAEDRDRAIDLVGHLDTVDPIVVLDSDELAIDAVVVANRRALRRFMRGMIEHVAARLHETRRVKLVQFAATTADRGTGYDPAR